MGLHVTSPRWPVRYRHEHGYCGYLMRSAELEVQDALGVY